jgi:hypothetical protein
MGLRESCEEERPREYELAPYTDEQIQEWVVQNPPEGALQPPVRHWQRVSTAFQQTPGLKDLCRTPMFLRMTSEVLVDKASIASRFDLIDDFCLRMWERERPKRTGRLNDAQYFRAYEAVSKLMKDGARLEPYEVEEWFRMYFDRYCPDLVEGLPHEEASNLARDIAIGPVLTYSNGIFSFVHEVLTGHFLSRLMARVLLLQNPATKDLFLELWNAPIHETTWPSLPEAVKRGVGGETPDGDRILREVALPQSSGLLAWNIARAWGAAVGTSEGSFPWEDTSRYGFGRGEFGRNVIR